MKPCNQCHNTKPLSEFYRHPKTADGYLPHCKECHKQNVKENRARKADRYREYEKSRATAPHRIELRKQYAKSERGKQISTASKRRYQKKNPLKRAVHVITGNAIRSGRLVKEPCQVCGNMEVHAHHGGYGLPLSVRWLCPQHHAEWHKHNTPII